MRRGLRLLILAATLLLVLGVFWLIFYFGMRNSHWVAVRVPAVHWSWENPLPVEEYEAQLWLVMLVAFGVGILLTMLLLVIPGWIRRGVERRRERRFISSLEGELSDLRNLPVNEPAPLEDLAEEPHPQPTAVADTEEEDELLAAGLQDPYVGSRR